MRRSLMCRAWLTIFGTVLAVMPYLVPASAADLYDRRRGLERGIVEPSVQEEPELVPLPRFFPREGSDGPAVLAPRPTRLTKACRPRRVPVPTDQPDDPSYVGSTYGLGKPSVYGFVPALGIDDPFGRSVLPYCR